MGAIRSNLTRLKLCLCFCICFHYCEARNDYTNNSETILLCNRCARNSNINSQRINVCNRRVHRKYLMKAPNYTK